MPTGRVTASAVAEAAGVSRATVSYVMNPLNRYTVAEKTRLKVLRVAAELGYAPSMSARALRGKRDLVLAIMPDWPVGQSMSRFLSALTTELRAHGLTILIRYANNDVAEYETLWRSLSPAAVLSFVEIDAEVIERAGREGVSVTTAFFDRAHTSPNLISIPEDVTGAMQVEYLVSTGRRRLAVAIPDDERLTAIIQPRVHGVEEGCERLKLAPPVQVTLSLTPEGSRAAVEELISAGVDGVCCYNDEVAIALLAGARGLGVEIPGRLAVIGVDDEPIAALVVPAVTTVRTDVEESAVLIAQGLLANIAGQNLTSETTGPRGFVVVRDSA